MRLESALLLALATLFALAGCSAPRKASPLGIATQAQTLEEASLRAALQGDLARAEALEQRALATYRSIDDVRGAAAALNRVGNLRQRQGDRAGARRAYDEARELARVASIPAEEAAAESNLGTLAESEGDLDTAAAHYQAALALAREADAGAIEAAAENNLALLALARGNLPEALERLEDALDIDRSLEDRGGEATRLRNLGAVHRAAGNPAEAIRALEKAHRIDRRREDMPAIALDLVALSEIRAASGGELTQAVNERSRALDIHRTLGNEAASAQDQRVIQTWCGHLSAEGSGAIECQSARLLGAASTSERPLGAQAESLRSDAADD